MEKLRAESGGSGMSVTPGHGWWGDVVGKIPRRSSVLRRVSCLAVDPESSLWDPESSLWEPELSLWDPESSLWDPELSLGLSLWSSPEPSDRSESTG